MTKTWINKFRNADYAFDYWYQIIEKYGIEKTAKSYETICNYIQSELKW